MCKTYCLQLSERDDAPGEDGVHVRFGGRDSQRSEREFPVMVKAKESDDPADRSSQEEG